MHVLNNLLAFGLALAFSDMSSALNPTGGSWWTLPVTLTQSLVYLGLALLVARRMGLTDRTDRGAPAVLEASARPRVRFPRPRSPAEGPNGSHSGIWCNWQHDWFWSS